jgi:hypothetical protein
MFVAAVIVSNLLATALAFAAARKLTHSPSMRAVRRHAGGIDGAGPAW